MLSNIIEDHQDKEILISVNERNIGSIKGVEKVGFRERESKSTCDIRDEVYQKNDKRELKVMIITMGLSRIVQPIVNLHNVVGVIECAPRKIKNKTNILLLKVTKKLYFFLKPSKSLKTYTNNKKIPYYYMNSGSDKSLENWVKSIAPDVIVVYSMSQLLKPSIFNIPEYGTINLHPALLPKYRGPFPDFWMYHNTEKKGGVTVHYIDEGEDTGDIIYQEKYDIPLGMKSPDMMDLAIGKIGTNLLLKALNNVEELPRQKQPKQSPTPRARNIKAEEHTNIINWTIWDIEKIWHLLRGTQLWLNAVEQPKGIYKGQRWTIDEFEKCDTSKYIPSKIYRENSRYFIACRDGIIFLSLNFSLKNLVLSTIR